MKKILEFIETDFEAGDNRGLNLKNINACVFRNEITGIYVEHGEDSPLFDLAEGMARPSRGTVEFMGKRWQEMGASELLKNRGRIGRTFGANAWLSNLTVLENLLLAQRHHTRRLEKDIREEADRLASMLGIEIPSVHSFSAPESTLRKCELIRAFLGRPDLALIDLAGSKGDRSDLDKLFALCRETAGNGTAFLLTTTDSQIWERVRQETNLNFILGLDGTLKQLENPV